MSISKSKSKNDIASRMKKERIAITMGDAGENHVGMEMLGNFGKEGSGFTVQELKDLKQYFKSKGIKTKLISFKLKKGKEEHNAGVLVLRNYLNISEQINMYREFANLDWDKKYYDTRRNKVLNKQARYNLMFLHGKSQKPDYKNKKGSIIDIDKLKYFSSFKKKLCKKINKICKNKADGLIAEGNRYFDVKKCGIGAHGDSERRKVICLSLGSDDYPIQWAWFHKNKIVSVPYKIKLNSGDVYIMSEKAVGTDWKKSSLYTMRHAAGADKYLEIKDKNK